MGNYWLDILEREDAVGSLGGHVNKAPMTRYGKKLHTTLGTATSRFLNEGDLEARWAKSGLLDGVEKDRYTRGQTAVLLEGQRLVNEISIDPDDVTDFKRKGKDVVPVWDFETELGKTIKEKYCSCHDELEGVAIFYGRVMSEDGLAENCRECGKEAMGTRLPPEAK